MKQLRILCNTQKNNEGFTLIELLIGLTIFVIVLAIVMLAILDLFKTDTNAKMYEELQQTSVMVLNDFIQEIRWSEELMLPVAENAGYADVTFRQNINGTVKFLNYHVDPDTRQLLKNNVPMTSDDVQVSTFNVLDITNTGYDIQMVQIQINFADKNDRTIFPEDKTISLSLRKKNFDL